MTSPSFQVIGLCRFSYPALGGFQVTHETTRGRSHYLYSAARLEERFRLFECITLPGIRAQTDPDFTFAVVIGADLPAPYLERLKGLLADIPQARLIAEPPGGAHRPTMRRIFGRLRLEGQPCLQFRHDDDDALCTAFVARLRAVAADCAPLLARYPVVGIDFNTGFVMRAGAQGIKAKAVTLPFLGVALAMAVRADQSLSIFNFGHHRLGSAMPTISLAKEAMFARGFNGHNDSRNNARLRSEPLSLLNAAGEAQFRRLFAIDTDHVRRVFSGST